MKKITISQKLEILEKVRKRSFKNYEEAVEKKDTAGAEELIKEIE